MRSKILMICLTLLAGACGSSTNPSSPSISGGGLTGTWTGDAGLPGQGATMTWTLTQSNQNVSGRVVVVQPSGTVLLNGTLTGTVSGSTLNYSITVNPGGIPSQPSCSGMLGGSATLSNAGPKPTLSGTYNLASSSCPTPFSTGTFTLTQQ